MKELYELKAAGRVRMIGVSNYTRRHLNILESANLRPDVLQIEVHPFLNQSELLKECESQGISVMSYRPLVLGEVVTHPGLAYLADSCNCTIAQMVLRWLIAKGTVPIPSSKDPTHIVDNFNASKVCMTKEVISSLDSLDRGYRTCSDPTWAEFDD
jgi:diketogulonate reductase-like aldo/keto reductase